MHKKNIKNIIFDLNGVLFESEKSPTGELNYVLPIAAGVNLLNRFQKEQAYKLYVCSNWKAPVFERLQAEFPDIFTVFDGLVHATLAQARKPDPRMFQFLFDTYNLIPEESLLLDDQIQNVESARALGMHGIQVSDFTELEKDLLEFRLLK